MSIVIKKRKKMNIYIICPVRNMTSNQVKEIDEYITSLEDQGHGVHSYKKVDQHSETGFEIVQDHFLALNGADRVDIFWDVTSKGSHMDLGMAFALGKHLNLVKAYQEDNEGKSYLKVIKKTQEVYENYTNNLKLLKEKKENK